MEESSDRSGQYLHLILAAATLVACVTQITSSMALINDLGCHTQLQSNRIASSYQGHSTGYVADPDNMDCDSKP